MADLTFHKLAWQDLEKDCIALAKKMKGVKFDTIIAISRGGLVASRIISDLLSVPISHITIASYQNAEQVKEPVVVESPSGKFDDETVLILDEVSDTGKTFHRALSHFKDHPMKKIYTAAPYIKPHTSYKPDFWVKSIDAWINFPYDLVETKESFMKIFGSEEKAKEKMKEIGFEDWEIEGVSDDIV